MEKDIKLAKFESTREAKKSKVSLNDSVASDDSENEEDEKSVTHKIREYFKSYN